MVPWLSPFYTWENGGPEKLNACRKTSSNVLDSLLSHVLDSFAGLLLASSFQHPLWTFHSSRPLLVLIFSLYSFTLNKVILYCWEDYHLIEDQFLLSCNTFCSFWIQSSGLFDRSHLKGRFPFLLLLHLFKAYPLLIFPVLSGPRQLLQSETIYLVINDLLHFVFASYMRVLYFETVQKNLARIGICVLIILDSFSVISI